MKQVRCDCSRCTLYLRVSTALGDLDYESQYALKQITFEDRSYQTALIEYGKSHNIMACLPTGSGKTYIALKLIDHYKTQIVSESKKVFFLANTIPLVNQQAAFIARNSIFKVRHLTGDMDVDYWSEDTWNAIVNEFQVIAMTSQIFLNMIRHGYIRFSQIALLIFDECHHAVEKHPMADIMKEYSSVKRTDPNYLLPRILGLSATIIKGTCKPQDVSTKIEELESIMQSAALTYKDYEKVLMHSTSAVVQRRSVSSQNPYAEQYVIEHMELLSKQLQELRKERKLAKLKAAKVSPDSLDPKLKTFDNVYNLLAKKPSPGDLKVALDDVLHAYKELGLYCTVIAINLRLAFIEFSLMDINDGVVKSWYHRVKEYFHELRAIVQTYMMYNEPDETKYVSRFVSPKIEALLEILDKYRRFESATAPRCEFGNDNRLCGLVFTDRRATAQVLAWYLKDLAKVEKYNFIRANFVVGTSRSAFESVETRVYARKQTETLNRFRIKELNLLTATSVLEEGIDVPSCNLVVRFDPVQTYTSYIQSMGRARRKEAEFVALLPDKDFLKQSQKLDTFQEINKKIIAHLMTNVAKIDADMHQIKSFWTGDLIPPICPGGTADSPKITMDSASEVLERYCMMLPSDGISTQQTLSWWNECLPNYQASLKLPLNSVLKTTIVGKPMRSKDLAKQAADMQACQMLLDAGVFNDQLIPVHPTLGIPVERFFTNLVPLLDETEDESMDVDESGAKDPKEKTLTPSVAQLFKSKWYLKRNPKVFTDTPLSVSSTKYYAYKVDFELFEERTGSPWKNLYNFESATEGFGMITSQMLPNVGVFPMYGAFGTIHCSVIPLRLKEKSGENLKLDPRLIKNMKCAQHKLFAHILGLKHPLLGNSPEPTFLVVSLIKVKGEWRINEKIEDDIKQLESIQKTKPPRRSRDQSEPRVPQSSSNLNKYKNAVIFPWYKRPKPAYLVDVIEENMTTRTEFQGSTYKNFLETEYRNVKIQNPNQRLLKCKLSGIALGRLEKDPIQLNYLLQKFNKEDEFPVYLVPELCYMANVPATFLVQLKLLPSAVHRISRLLLAQELLVECSNITGWPHIQRPNDVVPEVSELKLLSSAHEVKRKEEEERRKRRIELRNDKLRPKKLKPAESNKQHIEQRELHYEFIHPNDITIKDIRLFHEAVSIQHSARKLTLVSAEVELVDSSLSLPSKFELLEMEQVQTNLAPLEKNLNVGIDLGPSLLTIMEALSTKFSDEGLSIGRLQYIGSSFLSFAVSLFAFCNFPIYGEPILCQLRNRALTIQIISSVAKNIGLPELLSGSDFHPGGSWTPPGKQLVLDFLGEVAAANDVHLSVFDELISSTPNAPSKITGMTRKAIEEFADKKFKEAGRVALHEAAAAFVASSSDNPQPQTSQRKSQPNKPPGKYIVKHSTFTHTNLNDFDIVNGFHSLVGAFFTNSGPRGAYKALEWLGFQMPDVEGNGKSLEDLTLPEIPINPLFTGHLLYKGFESLENTIQYQFKDKSLLLQAFTHPTFPGYNLSECYQRLEFLGDAILDLLLTNYVYTQPATDQSPEDLQNIRAALVNSVTYSSLAVRYGFHKHLLSMSKPLIDMIDNFVVFQESVEHHVIGHFTLVTDEECRGPKHIEVPKVLCDLWEAVAGAIYIDSNKSLDAVWRVYYRLMQHELDLFWETKPKAPIHELKELMKKEDIEVTFKGFSGKKMQARGREIVRVDVGVYGYYFGMGTNKARAKDAAAKIALKLIKEENKFIKDRDASKIMLLC